MKSIIVTKRALTDRSTEEFIQTITTNFSIFILEENMTHITIDENRYVCLHEKVPTLYNEEEEDEGYCWNNRGGVYVIGFLPFVYDFKVKEAVWELDTGEIR